MSHRLPVLATRAAAAAAPCRILGSRLFSASAAASATGGRGPPFEFSTAAFSSSSSSSSSSSAAAARAFSAGRDSSGGDGACDAEAASSGDSSSSSSSSSSPSWPSTPSSSSSSSSPSSSSSSTAAPRSPIETPEGSSKIQLTKQRHETLLEAEIVHFARALKPHPITLQQILAQRDAEAYRGFLLEELPIRWARRLHLIESMPKWNEFPHMKVIRSLYSDAFRRLRMIPPTDAERFRVTLQTIKRRNANMLMHVVRGTRAMKDTLNLSDDEVNDFLDDFLTARIGTDILSSQYLAITRPGGATSVIDPECDPVNVVQTAALDATRLCKYHYGYAPPVDVIDVGQVRFPFITQYLNYIMFELLKNSLRAVTERYSAEDCLDHPVRAVVCGDDTTVVIRISDSGGGIPLEDLQKVWSYLYTTAKPQQADEGAAAEQYDSEDEDVAPMAGFGCGLPLSRNYASYVGGRLELNTMPHHGTDAYLYLNRLGNSQEVVDVEPKSAVLPSRGFLPRVR